MAFDDVVLRMGEFGPYQFKMFFILILPAISAALYTMGAVFLAATPDFRCLLPHEDAENATYQLPSNITNIAYPFDEKTGSWSRCERFDINLADQYIALDGNLSSMQPIIKCDSFVYDKTQYTLTATTEWNLVCENTWLKTLGGSLFMLGVMPGVLIFGRLSDRYGRKVTLLLGAIIQLVSGIVVTVSPELISFMIFRMLAASTTIGVFLVGYVTALEMVGPKTRLKAGIIVQLGFVTGYILTPLLAYYITNWRMLQIAFTIPSLTLLVFWRSSSESARWLMNKGCVREAGDILYNACLKNGVELSRKELDGLLTSDCNKAEPDLGKPSVCDLLRYPNLRKKSLLLFVIWFVNSITYWGLSWNTSNLGGDVYINFLVAGAVEIPAHLSQLFILDRWGRKIVQCGNLFIAGLSLLSTYLVPTSTPWLMILLAMIGKMAVTASFSTSYIFSTEQFPTAMRNIGIGACSLFARIGAVVAPQIISLSEVATYIPLVILGSASMIAGLLSLLLPETLNTKLPESIQDAEQFGKRFGESERDIESTNDVGICTKGTLKEQEKLKEQENETYNKQNESEFSDH